MSIAPTADHAEVDGGVRRRMRPLPRYLCRRALTTVLTLWALATLVFLMIRLIPGDPARVVAGENATPEQVAAAARRLGTDLPLPQQYLNFLGQVVRGDLGESSATFRPVLTDVAAVLPSTLELVVVAMLINLAVSIPIGVWAAVRHGRAADGVVRVGALMAGGVAPFWLALMTQYYFSAKLGWLPISGQLSADYQVPSRTGVMTLDALLAGNFPAFFDACVHLVLPAAVLALHFAAQLVRTMRTSMLSIMAQDFIRVGRAKGVPEGRLIRRHALPNALVPVLSLAGLQVGAMISLGVLVEVVFARAGIGSYIATSVTDKDLAATLGAVLFVGAVIVLVNLVTDLLQLALDPKVRHRVLRAGR